MLICVYGVGKSEWAMQGARFLCLIWSNKNFGTVLATEETAVSAGSGGGAERRVYMRWSVGVPVRVEAGGKIVKCELDNISGSGACARGRVRVSKGEEVVLHVSETRSIAATAVRVTPSEIGMEFLIDDHRKEQFIEYISHGLAPHLW